MIPIQNFENSTYEEHNLKLYSLHNYIKILSFYKLLTFDQFQSSLTHLHE